MENLNNSFSFSVNLTGVKARGMARKPPVEGYYKGEISESYINMDRNPNRVVFKVKFEGEYSGAFPVTTGIFLPGTGSFDSRPQWRTLLESAGFSGAQLDQGAVNVGAETLVGRPVHFYYKPKNENAEEGTKEAYDTAKFLSPTHWNSAKELFDKAPKSTPVATKTPVATQTKNLNTLTAPAAPQAGLASANVTTQDLLSMVK